MNTDERRVCMDQDFTKYEALGNDYLVIDPSAAWASPTADTVRMVTDRRRGVGADGLLFGPLADLGPGDGPPLTPDGGGGVFGLRIFNSDGTPCARSGNGIRVFARYLMDHGYAGADDFTIRTDAGPTAVRVLDRASGLIRLALGPMSSSSRDVGATGHDRPMLRETLRVDGENIEITCLSDGNPHCVVVRENVTPELAHALGPRIAGHPAFPGRVNVEFVQVRDHATVRAEIWERGAGYTLASGSGACAAARAAQLLGLTGEKVTVEMPGGSLEVETARSGEVSVTGTAAQVATGRWAPDFRARLTGRRP
ncbi:diaminopimelate epimerase [Streptomyces fungicidicus]|uniref:diaminopimelate epimerase n=1 Tax=Streptomyces fungicidicus TaxID=68203 RepID=UPI0033F3C52C